MAGLFCFPAICVLGQNGFATSDSVGKVNVLKEVEVRGYGTDRNLKAPEMGRVSFSNKMISSITDVAIKRSDKPDGRQRIAGWYD